MHKTHIIIFFSSATKLMSAKKTTHTHTHVNAVHDRRRSADTQLVVAGRNIILVSRCGKNGADCVYITQLKIAHVWCGRNAQPLACNLEKWDEPKVAFRAVQILGIKCEAAKKKRLRTRNEKGMI